MSDIARSSKLDRLAYILAESEGLIGADKFSISWTPVHEHDIWRRLARTALSFMDNE